MRNFSGYGARAVAVCVTIAVGASGMSACGSAGKTSATIALVSGRDADGDVDTFGQGGRYDTDNDAILGWAPPASGADRKAIVSLIRRYYGAAAAGNGAAACSMLDPLVAEGYVEEHRGKGPIVLQGEDCTQVMSKLFEQSHRGLVEDVAAFRVTVVQRRGNRALALLDFSPTRLLQVMVRRSEGVWRMDVPLDSGAE